MLRHTTPRTARLAVPAVLACLTLLTACGGSDDSAAQTAPSTVTMHETVTAAPGSETATPTGDRPADTPNAPTPATPADRPSNGDAAVQDAKLFERAPGDYYFISPSRNIYCAIRSPQSPASGPDYESGCQAVTSVKPLYGPTCANSGSNAYMVRFTSRGVVHECTNQGIFVEQNPRVLEYGQSLAAHGITCTSAEVGITCRREGTGFRISRDINTLFR